MVPIKQNAERVEVLAQHVEKNGGKVACLISQSTPKENSRIYQQ